MASVVYKPPPTLGSIDLEVRVGQIIYTLSAGVPTHIPAQHYAAVQAAVAAAVAGATAPAGPSDI